MDKGLLLLEQITQWQENEVTVLLKTGLQEILQSIREGYIGCNADQFERQKGREMQTIVLLDLIEREPSMWIDMEDRPPQNKPVKGEITHEDIETAT